MWIPQYTTDALTIQLSNAVAWFAENGHSERFNYTDDERAEMLHEIEELKAEINARAA